MRLGHASDRHGSRRLRKLFRGVLREGTLATARGAWLQLLTEEGAREAVRDGSVRLHRSPGQLVMVSNVDVERWADVALLEVVTAYPQHLEVRAIGGACPDGEVYVESVTRRIRR